MSSEAAVVDAPLQSAERLEQASLWHLNFFAPLAARSATLPEVVKATKQNSVACCVVYSASLLEAVGYNRAGTDLHHYLRCKLQDNSCATHQPRGWLDVLSAHVRQHSDQFLTPRADPTTLLTAALRETQHVCAAPKTTSASSTNCSSPLDPLLAALASDYMRYALGREDQADSKTSNDTTISLFQLVAPSNSSAAASSASTPASPSPASDRGAAVRQQRQWYEARLYGALACAASLTTPGPLARLLVAYAHAHDSRLRLAVDETVTAHLRAADTENEELRGGAVKTAEQTQLHSPPVSLSAEAAAAQARVRLSGIVAGVLEYAMHVARTRSAATAAALNATVAPSVSAQTDAPSSKALTAASAATQSAALLLVQLTEECDYYQQTASRAVDAGDKESVAHDGATSTATAIVHAVQELLFTLVLGGGTVCMLNRPTPVAPKKATLSADPAPSPALLVVTSRGVCLSEADAVTQELFPALVQQLGLEWCWSPLLRHLSSLDKQQQPQQHQQQHILPVRWSSSLLMDTVLLALARKTYPQRLLNILPGSYERLLQNLDLLPPMRAPDDASGDGAAAAARPMLFDMPVYYKDPANALVAYFQRAGTAGLRLEEVTRILTTATGSYPMVVRLKAQAPSLTEVDDLDNDHDDGDKAASVSLKSRAAPSHSYALSRERVRHLIARYQGEVLLAAVIVHTQLRTPSQVQQLMRALAPLFLALHLEWRTHHDGSVVGWFLQPQQQQQGRLTFSKEATVLLDKVGYEFYPLEWLPALAASVNGGAASVADAFSSATLPYSLCAAVGHQFRLQLRGTPLGGSGDATLRHPAGPRAAAVMPTGDTTSFLADVSRDEKGSRGAGDAEASAAAWRRAERFFTGLLHVCYLDPKTSSTDLEGTLAVSSTRRVLTASDGLGHGLNYSGGSVSASGAPLVAAGDIAAQRLRALLQQPAVMDAMWGSMEAAGTAGEAKSGRTSGNSSFSRGPPHDARRGQKRSRATAAASSSPEEARAEAVEQLRAMRQLLIDYGASSFDTTVEAADFALTVAQGFLPSTAGMSAAVANNTNTTASRGRGSDALLQRALEWCREAVGAPASKARVNMLLQQQQQQQQQQPGGAPPSPPASLSLVSAYNSASLDMAWLARSILRHVPRRIWEKISAQQTQARVLAERETRWLSRLPGEAAHKHSEAATQRVDPLLLEQWTQCVRVWQQLGFAEGMSASVTGGSGVDSFSSRPASADEMSCAQWLWYSPYFSAEWAAQ